jgi:hypothetical protein
MYYIKVTYEERNIYIIFYISKQILIHFKQKIFHVSLINPKVKMKAIEIYSKKENIKNFSQAFVDTYSSKAIWLLFLDTSTSLKQFFTDINIPFDCQFLVAQPQSDHVVLLTEVYRVSPTLPLQTYLFGNWTAGGGLTWLSQDFYMRRKNLKGLTIQATRLNVRGTCTTCETSNSSLENRAIH